MPTRAPDGRDHTTPQTALGGDTPAVAGDPAATVPRDPTAGPGGLPPVPGFEVAGELARGGMGVVLTATETALGRRVAVKTLLPGGADADAARRFVAEARITAQLPHPGIPPIHRVGELADGRPFLAMKLIEGRTLAAALGATDRPDLLHAFEQICQAVGFAHSRGIVHRDLKPLNVMIGAFGEVQVMDWGLAKQLRVEGAADDARPEPAAAPGADETRAGRAMGTPQYMPPEQARGEWDRVDARADVFALGGILAAILTGRPPHEGGTTQEVLRRAAAADLGACFARLDGCGADAELVALAKRCLAPAPADRPADAAAVADEVSAYRAGVQARLAAAVTARAAAAAKLTEERKKRRAQFALAAVFALLVAGAGGVALWARVRTEQEKAARATRDRERVEEEAKQAALARDKEKAEGERAGAVEKARGRVPELLALATALRTQYRFDAAAGTLAQAAELAAGAGLEDLKQPVAHARSDLDFVRELDRIRDKKWVWVFPQPAADAAYGRAARPPTAGRFDTDSAPPAYRAAFAARGLDPDADPAAVAARVRASAVRAELVAALDDWAVYERDDGRRDRLLAALRAADPGDWLDRFRTPAERADAARLKALAADLPPDVSAAAIASLAALMTRYQLDPTPVLAAGTERHPADFAMAFARGRERVGERLSDFNISLGGGAPPTSADPKLFDAIGFLRVARTLRPDNIYVALNLGQALSRLGKDAEAAAALRAALAIDPNIVSAYVTLGEVAQRQKDWPEVLRMYREVLKRDRRPLGLATFYMGQAMERMGDRDGMLKANQEAVALHPDYAIAHSNLGTVLNGRRDTAGAIRAYRRAIELDPASVLAYQNLGPTLFVRGDHAGAIPILERWVELEPTAEGYTYLAESYRHTRNPDRAVQTCKAALLRGLGSADLWCAFGAVARDSRDWAAAAAHYRQAAAKDPKSLTANANLGRILGNLGDWAGAVEPFARAVAAQPDNPQLHNFHGVALYFTGKYAEAAAAYRRALEHDPKNPRLYDNLGEALLAAGDMPGATAACRKALDFDPKLPTAQFHLGRALHHLGELGDAAAAFEAAARLDPKTFGHVRKWLPLKPIAPPPRPAGAPDAKTLKSP